MNILCVKIQSGLNSDGFAVQIQDESGAKVFSENYHYGWNASYKREFAQYAHQDVLNAKKYGWKSAYCEKPYTTDILEELVKKYHVEKIYVSPGEYIFSGQPMGSKEVKEFINRYIKESPKLMSLLADDAVEEQKAVSVIERIDQGISIRQAIIEAAKPAKPALLLEDVVGMDPQKADDFKVLMDKWVGSNSSWKYDKFTENNGKTFFVRLTKNPIAKLPDAVDLEVTRDVLNGEIFYDKAGEFLAASGPVSLAGLKSILRDLLSQVEMVDSEVASTENASEDGNIYGY